MLNRLRTRLLDRLNDLKDNTGIKAQQYIVRRFPVPRSIFVILLFYLYKRMRRKKIRNTVIMIAVIWVPLLVILIKDQVPSYLNKPIGISLLMPLFALIIFCSVKLIKMLFSKRSVKNQPFAQKFFKFSDDNKFTVHVDGRNISRFHFASKNEAAISAFVNMRVYEGGVWATDCYDKYIRNKSHIERNKFSIVLIRCQTTDEYIGFTHVLPVTENIWESYCKGLLADNLLRSENIIGDDEPNPDRIHGFILFSAGIGEEDKDFTGDMADYIGHETDLLEECLAYHVQQIIFGMGVIKNPIPLLFTNVDDVFYKGFEQKSINGLKVCADDAPIFIFNIENPR